MQEIARLIQIMEQLRNKDFGCPWDLKQTPSSLKPYILEEAYEVIEAIDDNNPEEMKKELGDLLLQVVFQAQIAKESKQFDFEAVAKSISDKLISRHPHIFETSEQLTPEEVKVNWEQLKMTKEGKKRILDGIPKSFNALLRSFRIQEKAAAVGFEWPDTEGILNKLAEETEELHQAIRNNDMHNAEEELGDMLFVLVNLAKRLNINPEDALQKTNNKFIKRFNYIEEHLANEKSSFDKKSLEELDAIWVKAKEHFRK